MRRQVELISAAWGLGGVDPGCADAPAVLAPLLLSRLREYGIPTLPGPILRPSPTERRKQVAVSRLCSLLASAVADSLRHGRLPCVLGGDHTCAGGTWTGVARGLRGDLGLVWVDAHMDSHTPGTSHTGRLHGMPLAWLLGQDDDPLSGLAAGLVWPQSSWSNIARGSTTAGAARRSRWICWLRRYAGRATMRRSSPRRSTDSSLSLRLSPSAASAGRSSIPCAASPRKLGFRYTRNSSTQPSRTSDPFSRKPASTCNSLMPRRASSSSMRGRSTFCS